jgi:hypothetical protein
MRHSMTYGDADRTRVVWTTAAMTRQASTGSTLDSRKGRHRNMIRGGVRSGGDVRPPHPLDVKRRRPSVGRPDIPCFSPCIQLAAHRALERPAPSGTLPDSECTARQGSASRWSSHRGPSRTSHRLGRVIRSVWPPGRRACFVGRAQCATRAALRRRGLGCEGKLVALGVAPDRRHAGTPHRTRRTPHLLAPAGPRRPSSPFPLPAVAEGQDEPVWARAVVDTIDDVQVCPPRASTFKRCVRKCLRFSNPATRPAGGSRPRRRRGPRIDPD